MTYYTAGFLFSEDNTKVALIRKLKPNWMIGLLNGIGGKIELQDDSPLAAQIREFKEEAGVVIDNWEEFCKIEGEDFWVYFFKANGDLSKLTSVEEEQVEIIEVDKVYTENILDNLTWLIPMALSPEKIYSTVKYF